MKKLLALALLVSFVGVRAADAGDGGGGPASRPTTPTTPATSSMFGQYQEHPWAAGGGGVAGLALYFMFGGRDFKQAFAAGTVGAGAGVASKLAIDKVAPDLPDTHVANVAKGLTGPLVVRWAPTLLDTVGQGTRAIRR